MNKLFLSLIVFSFLIIGMGGVLGVECGATPTDGCTVSTSTTFNTGTYYLNGSSNGAINIAAHNVIIDGNGSILIGNFSYTPNFFSVGIYSTYSNLSIKNISLINFYHGNRFLNSKNFSIEDSNIINCSNAFNLRNTTNSSIFNNNFILNNYDFYLDTTPNINLYLFNNNFSNTKQFVVYDIIGNLNLSFDNNIIYNTSLFNMNNSINFSTNNNQWSNPSPYIDGVSHINSFFYNTSASLLNEYYDNGMIHIRWDSSITFDNLSMHNCLGDFCFEVFNGYNSNINIKNSYFNNLSRAISIRNTRTNNFINISNNIINNITTNVDAGNEGIRVANSTNVLINKNNITNFACVGSIIYTNSSNINLTNNFYSQIQDNLRTNTMHCDSDISAGISINQLFRTWTEGNSDPNENYLLN